MKGNRKYSKHHASWVLKGNSLPYWRLDEVATARSRDFVDSFRKVLKHQGFRKYHGGSTDIHIFWLCELPHISGRRFSTARFDTSMQWKRVGQRISKVGQKDASGQATWRKKTRWRSSLVTWRLLNDIQLTTPRYHGNRKGTLPMSPVSPPRNKNYCPWARPY